MKRPALVALLCAALLGGCAVPGWVPVVGKKPNPKVARKAPAAGEQGRRARRTPETVEMPKPPLAPVDDRITDRIVAVVNSDAITLGELQESVAVYRHENGARVTESDEQLAKEFLTRLIDNRLQLQEAEREKITAEESEVAEELEERIKRVGANTMEQFEAMVRAQGLTMDSIRKRVRDSLRTQKVIRRKVALRVSVTDEEIDRYVTENRTKLETGLGYHARHILITPETNSDTAWEAARIRADMIRTQILGGADFEAMARKTSSDATAKEGGDLGPLKRGELAQEIETQILALQPGQLSMPYRSSLGYHIFRLESKETLEGEALTRARQQIQDILFRQKYQARLDAWLKEIKQRAIIEVRM